MRKLILLLLVTALSATGCIQMHMDTAIQKDGSGVMTMEYGMSPSVAEALAEMAKMPGGGDDQTPTLDSFKADQLEESCRKNGCKLKDFEHAETKVSFAVEFPSLEKLSMALSDGQAFAGGGFALYRTAGGDYTIREFEYEGEPVVEEEAEAEVAEPAEAEQEFNPEDMQKSMEMMGKLMGAAGELKVSMRITVPGDVIEHNAHRIEGRTLIWEIDSSNMMTMGGEMEPNIVFSGKGLSIDAPPVE